MTPLTGQPAIRRGRFLWPLTVCLLAMVPVARIFTYSKIFYVRDLSFFFWSRHLWLRQSIFGGSAPWWDPYVGGGQSAVADALNQILMPLTLMVRLLPSDVVSFNIWVALPLPIAALGTYFFLRRTRTSAAAALGSAAFALAGVPVSMLNTPNLAWSVAALPWVLFGVAGVIQAAQVDGAERRQPPRVTAVVVLAVVFALQALSGEPVTCAATGAVAIAYAVALPTARMSPVPLRERLVACAWVGIGLASGAFLAAAQLVPTIAAGLRAHRGELPVPDFWSLHPLAAIEIVAPHLFGNYYDSFLADIPWMTVLNSGRDPFFYSIYVGPLVLGLAVAGIAAVPRNGIFWGAVAVIFALAAMGGHTPFYPIARQLIPALAYFRFPIKYLAITVFACAVLVADGWDSLRDEAARPSLTRVAKCAAIAALALAAVVIAATAAHHFSWNALYALASGLKITNPSNAADFLLRLAPYLLGRAAGLLLAGAVLLMIAASPGPRARMAACLLWIALCVDLAVTHADLNLTSDVRKHTPPAWYLRLASEQRVYIGGRVRGFMNTNDPDSAQSWKVPAEATAVEGRMELNAELPMAPSGWRVREALSYDLPVLWPAEYDAVVRAFEHAGRRERAAFLRRSAVRWCVLPLSAAKPALVEVAHWEMGLIECDPAATRAVVAMRASFGADANWQRAALFHAASRDDELRLAVDVPPSGVAGPPETASARLVRDAGNEVIVDARLPAEGYVILRDSYDSSWRADVDGTPAAVARANGLYRAVKVSPGRHLVRFRYRPRELYAGLILSGATALALAAGWWVFRIGAKAAE